MEFYSPENNEIIYSCYVDPRRLCEGQVSRGEVRLCLEDLLGRIDHIIKPYMEGYLWNHDKFNLCIDIQKHCLKGKTHFGMAVQDEWKIVDLLMKVSQKIDLLIIEVQDNYGNFILVECSDVIEEWINPTTEKNRVFIHGGHIHIIDKKIWDTKDKLELRTAISIVANRPKETIASDKINERIGKIVKSFLSRRFDICKGVYISEGIFSLLHHRREILPSIINCLDGVENAWEEDVYNPPNLRLLLNLNGFREEKGIFPLQLTQLLYDKCINHQWSQKEQYRNSLDKYKKHICDNNPSREKDCILGLNLTLGFIVFLRKINSRKSELQVESKEVVLGYEETIKWLEKEVDLTGCEYMDLDDEPCEDGIEDVQEYLKQFSMDEKEYFDVDFNDLGDLSETESSCTSMDTEDEIMECIKNDPDLLMKVIEKSGGDHKGYSELIDRLKNVQLGMSITELKGKCEVERAKRKVKESSMRDVRAPVDVEQSMDADQESYSECEPYTDRDTYGMEMVSTIETHGSSSSGCEFMKETLMSDVVDIEALVDPIFNRNPFDNNHRMTESK